MPQSVSGRNDPQAEIDADPALLVVARVTVHGVHVARQNVLQPAERQVFIRRNVHQAHAGRVRPFGALFSIRADPVDDAVSGFDLERDLEIRFKDLQFLEDLI